MNAFRISPIINLLLITSMFKPILFFLNTKSKIIEGKNLNKIETVEWINSNKHHICFIKAIDKRVKNHYISTPTSFHH